MFNLQAHTGYFAIVNVRLLYNPITINVLMRTAFYSTYIIGMLFLLYQT